MKKNYLLNVSKFCSSSEIKPEIARVYVEREGDAVIMTATDSYALVNVKYKNEDGLITITPGFYTPENFTAYIKEFNKAYSKKETKVTGTVIAGQKIAITTEKADSMHFPEWQQLIKGGKFSTGLNQRYNPGKLAEVLAFVDTFSGPFPKFSDTEDNMTPEAGRLKMLEKDNRLLSITYADDDMEVIILLMPVTR